MFGLNNIYTCFIALLILIMPIGMQPFINNVDEVGCGILLMLAFFDSIINRKWGSYKLLWIIIAIFGFYILYSLYIRHSNTLSLILMDAFIEAKPFIAFSVVFGSRVRPTDLNRKLLRLIAAVSATFMSIVTINGYHMQRIVAGHAAFAGMSIYVSVILFLLCSINEYNEWKKNDLILAFIWLTCGLMCGRSKFFAEFVLTLFFVLIYKPGILKHFKFKHIVLIVSVCALVIIVVWHKFSYYFITGNSDTFDPNDAASFARPALYLTGFLIFLDNFRFGSGLASFASYASSINYSQTYYEYNLDKVWGLSPTYNEFICDAYYPSLAQFGIAGLILFIIFWRYAYRFLLKYIRKSAMYNRNYFVLGTLLMCFILIECTTGTGFTTPFGFMAMILFSLICRNAVDISTAAQGNEVYSNPCDNNYIDAPNSKRLKI